MQYLREEYTKSMKKKMYLEYLRAISMFSVVLIHIFVTARTDFSEHTVVEEIISNTLGQILHYAVPIFFMITGAIFLQENKQIDLSTLYKKYIKRYVLIILIFGWGFAFIEQISNKEYSFMAIVNSFICMIKGETWAHMWYLYTLIGIMMILPIIKLIVEKSSENNNLIKYTLIILIIFSCFATLMEDMFGFKIGIVNPINSIYIAYMIWGYLIDKKTDRCNIKIPVSVIFIASIIIIACNIAREKLKLQFLEPIGSYNSPVIMLMSIALFELIKELINNKKHRNTKLDEFILGISKYTFGVYIIHMFWINVAYKLLKINPYGELMIGKVIILYICTISLSIISTKILKKLPIIKKLKFYRIFVF